MAVSEEACRSVGGRPVVGATCVDKKCVHIHVLRPTPTPIPTPTPGPTPTPPTPTPTPTPGGAQGADEGPYGGGSPPEKRCCAFDCGGMLGCKQVGSEAECEMLNGSLNEGVCTATTEEERLEYGIYGRCNGGTLWPWEQIEVEPDLKGSSVRSDTDHCEQGDEAQYTVHITNSGIGLAIASLANPIPAGLESIPDSATATSGEVWPPGSDPFDNLISWQGCVPPGGEVNVTYAARVSEGVAGGPIVNTAILADHTSEEAFALEGSLTVAEAEPEAPPASYTWKFTITPSGISLITVPIPDDIGSALRNLDVERLIKVSGELHGLELGETDWILSGIVMSPGFLPFISTAPSTAIYAGQDADGLTRATLTIVVTVAKAETPIGIPGLLQPGAKDSDGDTVPDDKDYCPDVPGEPPDGCPIYEEYPDADADGTPDIEDACPYEPGPPENDGCPSAEWEDTDGDGVPDWQDWCPGDYGDDIHGCPKD
jgi:uncharacterized repeat protein (TIGR01451 family)